MRAAVRILSFSVLALLLVLGASGCGQTLYKPSGKILKNGEPFTLSPKGMFVVSATAADDKEGKQSYSVNTKSDGTFDVSGKDGKGVPAGKYRFSIKAMDPYEKQQDLLGGKLSGKDSPVVEEIKSNDPITIDVSKYTGGGGGK